MYTLFDIEIGNKYYYYIHTYTHTHRYIYIGSRRLKIYTTLQPGLWYHYTIQYM